MAKLTKAQSEFLASAAVADNGRVACVETYKPAIKLVEAGFAVWWKGNPYGGRGIEITESGRAALKEK